MSGRAAEGGALVFAGGGTGGHLFPSLAVVEQLALRRGEPTPPVHFICSDRPIDRRVLDKAGVAYTPLSIGGVPASLARKAAYPFRFLAATGRSRRTLEAVDAAVVVAMGGFISAPVGRAARKLGLPVIRVNLDAVAGKANRWLVGARDRLFSVYDQPGLAGQFETIGYPLRRCVIGRSDPAEARAALGLKPEPATLLITGASQGARTINQAAEALARRGALRPWQVLHLAGEGNVESIQRAYREAGVNGKVLAFLEEMHLAWSAADLAISRAGAGSVAEVRANAVPTLFMPYPYHADEHQRQNASPLEKAGAAVIIDDHVDPQLNADQLEQALAALRSDEASRRAMRDRLAELSFENGAARLAEAAVELRDRHRGGGRL